MVVGQAAFNETIHGESLSQCETAAATSAGHSRDNNDVGHSESQDDVGHSESHTSFYYFFTNFLWLNKNYTYLNNFII